MSDQDDFEPAPGAPVADAHGRHGVFVDYTDDWEPLVRWHDSTLAETVPIGHLIELAEE
jgi:hypothetical protein